MKKTRKLRLNAEDLRIESFDTDAGTAAGHGTVRGFARPAPDDTYSFNPGCHCVRDTNPLYDCTLGCNTPQQECA
jgi:hypothetical protein